MALVISSPLVANNLPFINLSMALGNLAIAANGLPLVPVGNDIQVEYNNNPLTRFFSINIVQYIYSTGI